MYNIRLAKEKDWDAIAPMCDDFYKFTEQNIPYDEETTKQLFLDIVCVEGTGEVILAESDGEAVGMIAFVVSPFMTNRNVLVGTELLWWVDPTHRGGPAAKELKRTAEYIAKHKYGATRFVMSALKNSPRAVDVLYRREGYKAQDTSYMKEL